MISALGWVPHLQFSHFPAAAEAVFRCGYGILLLLQLALTWPSAMRFYADERNGGYIDPEARPAWLHTRVAAATVMVLWTLCAVALVVNRFALPAAILNLAFARYYFLHLRWRSILRGMGAPGHMNHWIGAFLAFLLFSDAFDRDGLLRAATVVVFRTDFAFIMIAAGVYKIVSGYARGDGFERGLVNPWWGFWWRSASKLPSDLWMFRLLNHLAYIAEVGCGTAFLIPAVSPYAAAFFALSFLFIGAMIRLTFLAEMVALCCVIYITPGDAIGATLARILNVAPHQPVQQGPASWLAVVLSVMLLAYLAALPFAYAGLAVNFYGKRRLPAPLQSALDAFNRVFGLILWRVFTADLIHFYADIFALDEKTQELRLVRTPWRFWHVGEFITLASAFTTLKYYPHDRPLFERRILRYARSLTLRPSERALFRYKIIEKRDGRFSVRDVAEFEIDGAAGTVVQRDLDPTYDVRSTVPGSPVSAGSTPGSYAPRGAN